MFCHALHNLLAWGHIIPPQSAAYLENREGGQGLRGRHFTQGGRCTVVIGGTFRRDFSSLGGRPFNYIFPVNTWKDFSEGLFGGTFRMDFSEGLFGGTFRRWREPEGYLQLLHFPCKQIRD